MYVSVKALHEGGIPLARRDIEESGWLQGELTLTQELAGRKKRSYCVARVHQTERECRAVLPPLHDAQLIWIGSNTLMLTGFEVINLREVVQSWLVKTDSPRRP